MLAQVLRLHFVDQVHRCKPKHRTTTFSSPLERPYKGSDSCGARDDRYRANLQEYWGRKRGGSKPPKSTKPPTFSKVNHFI